MPKPRRPKTEAQLRDAHATIADLRADLVRYEGNRAAMNLLGNWLKQQEQKAANRQRELAEADVFALRLRGHREAKGLTQIELAKRSGVGQAMISLLEQGDRKPSWDTIRKLATGLRIGVEEFQ